MGSEHYGTIGGSRNAEHFERFVRRANRSMGRVMREHMENQDQKFIAQALKLAKKTNPSPNPRVGAIIVKDGKIIGKGYHKAAGERHAEIIAIQETGLKAQDLSNATLYVTLEPCLHYGKTPPCTDAIIDSGIKKIVIGCEDQNPKVEGIEKLKQAGRDVTLLKDQECYEINEAFFHWIKTGKPFVMLKLAMTLDGRIATKTGDSKYISNSQSRALSYAWRDNFDAIMVGLKTILIDNPRLTSRTPGVQNPARLIVDSRLRIPLTSQVLESNARRIIATTDRYDKEKKKQLETLGVEILFLKEEKTYYVDLKQLFEGLGKQNIISIMVEGGAELATALLEKKIINKAAFFIAAKILGSGKNAFDGSGVEKMDDALQLKNVSIRKLGEDVLVVGYF